MDWLIQMFLFIIIATLCVSIVGITMIDIYFQYKKKLLLSIVAALGETMQAMVDEWNRKEKEKEKEKERANQEFRKFAVHYDEFGRRVTEEI